MKKFTLLLIFILSITSGKILAQCVTVGPDITICQGSPVPSLGATMINGTTDILWSDDVGGAFSDPAKIDATWTPPLGFTGTATLTLTPMLGCLNPPAPASLKVNINPQVTPSVSISATATTICSGTSVTFTANPANGGVSPAYSWRINSIPVGTNSNIFTTSTLDNGEQVTVIMTSSDPCATIATANSNMIQMTVNSVLNASVTIGASPAGPICAGTTVLFTATPSNGGSPTYEWTVDGNPVGTNSSTYSSSTLINGNVVRVRMTSNLPCVTGSPANSNEITTTVNAAAPASVSIAASSNNVCSGTNVTFTATPTNGGTTPTYQWRVNGANVGPNSTNATYSSSTLATNSIVTVLMTSNLGCVSGSPAASNAITMTVNPTTPVSVSIAALPTGAICAGTSVTFTATPTGGGTPTYQWRINGVNAGTNNASFTSTTLSNNDAVTVQMTSSLTCPSAAPATSNTINMSVNALPTAGLTSSDPDHTICAGTSVTFTASGGSSYTFYRGGTIVQTGNSPTYITNALVNGESVYVIVSNAALCTATSSSITFFVNPVPSVTLQSATICAPNLATYSFTVLVTFGTVTTTAGAISLTSPSIYTVTVPAGQNTIVRSTQTGCVGELNITAPNCSCPVIQAPTSGGNRSYCAGGTIPALTATVGTGETIDWFNVAIGGAALATGLSYTPAVPGTYYALTRNTTTSCVSSSRTAIILTSNPLPVVTIVSSETDNTFCTGASVTFTGSGGTNYNFRIAGVSAQSGVLTTFTTTALTNGQIVDVIVTNAGGCIATSAGITNTVRALPTPTLTSSDADNTFCSGSSVTFTASGGTNYNFRVAGASVQNSAATTYVTNALLTGQVVDVIVTNANGCSATSSGITNTVSALPVPLLTSSDADHQFCFGTSVSFTAGTGSTNYNFRVGGTTVQNGASNIYTTSTLTNGQAVDVITTNAAGCTATSAAITNVVSPQPTANGGAGGNICGLTFKFSGVPGIGLGTWTKTTGPGNATFAPNANTSNATVTVTEYGAYTFTWTEVSGQCSASSVVAVNFYLQPVSNAGTGGNNCGLGFHFSGSLNTGVGTWAKVSGPGNVTYSPDANTPNALVTVSGYGTYTFSWTVVNGTCSNSSNVNVVFIQQVPASGGSDGSECDKDFVLNATLPTNGTGTWTKFAGPGNAVFAPDNHTINAKVTVDKFGTYDFAWTVVNSTCSSSDVVRVVFHDLPAINAGRDTIMCKGSSVQLKASGSGTVAWTPAARLNNASIINPVASPDVTTSYTVNLTDQYGCKNSDNMILEVRERTVADAGPDQVLGYVLNSTLNANLAHDYEKGFWSIISGTSVISDSTYAKSSVEELSIGLNEFLWTVTNGFCPISVDSANIVVNDFVIPTLITPNMDGRNDYFVLSGLSTIGKADLVIFDRRGAQVYKNADYDNLWDGVDYNNNPLPEGTYFYVLKTENGKSLSGYIVIRR